MKSRFVQNALRFILLIFIAFSSGCGQSTPVASPTLTPVPSQTPTETATAIPNPTNTPEPIHPEGTIFYMVREPFQDTIYSVELKSQQTKVALQFPDFSSYQILGNSIYVTLLSEKSQRFEIFRTNLDGSGKEQLTTLSKGVTNIFEMDPTHHYLIYNDRYNNVQVSLRILDLQNKKSDIIAEPDKPHDNVEWFLAGPWSPDGKKLIYYKDISPGGGDICILFVYDVPEKKSIRLFPEGSSGCTANWSPNGKNIAFSSATFQPPIVYVLNLESNTLKRFPIKPENPFGPYGLIWSLGGTKILFSTGRIVYLLNADSGNLEVISTYPDFTHRFMSSPDRNMVLYEQNNRTENSILYLFNIEKKQTVKIYSQSSILAQGKTLDRIDWYYSTVWSPNGKYIAYFTTLEPDNYSRTDPRPIFLNVYSAETGGTVSFEVPASGHMAYATKWIYP